MTTKRRFTAQQLRELLMTKKIANDGQLIGDTGGVIPYLAFRNGFKKKSVVSAWQVLTPGRRTDPDGTYADDFNKTFTLSEPGQLPAQEQAKLWASEVYDIHDWAKTPFGSWTSKAYLDTRLLELLPEHFDPDYRDPTVAKIVAKLYGDDTSERMFRIQVQLYAKPEPPLYVSATSEDDARRQVTQLFTRVAGTRVLDGLKLHINET